MPHVADMLAKFALEWAPGRYSLNLRTSGTACKLSAWDQCTLYRLLLIAARGQLYLLCNA